MKAMLVNMSRWRSDHITAAYEAALRQSGAASEPAFLVVSEGHNSACVGALMADQILQVLFSHHKTGDGSSREETALAALATGRTLDDGSFGQFVKYMALLLADEKSDERPARCVPRWAKDLAFTQRDRRDEPLKIVTKLRDRSYKLGITQTLYHHVMEFLTEEDVNALLKYSRVCATRVYKQQLGRALRECAGARERLRKTRTQDRRNQRYLDKLDRIEEARAKRA